MPESIQELAKDLAERMLEASVDDVIVFVDDEAYQVSINGPCVLTKKNNRTLEDFIQEGWAL